MKDLREAVLSKKTDSAGSTRQMKEAIFEVMVRQNVYEERQNQLRWQVRLGEEPMSTESRLKILDERQLALARYQTERGDPVEDSELSRLQTQCTFRRTIRDKSKVGNEDARFDVYTNDLWAARHAALFRFQQAARTVMIRSRVQKKLKTLKQSLLELSNKKPLLAEKSSAAGEEEGEEVTHILEADRVHSVTFATYNAPNTKDDMAVDALGGVPYVPTEVSVKYKAPYHELKVPKHYELMGYEEHSVHEASRSYVPLNLARTLRIGAEEEIIQLEVPDAGALSQEVEPVTEGDMVVEEVTSDTPAPTTILVPEPLLPPQAIFKPVDYPALHIFNPAPGLQVFQAPLPYAEVDTDFHLCPLPRYTAPGANTQHSATQKQYLDREDVIKGMMTWKRFPSQGLTSLTNTPTLTSVWVPRWSDPFQSGLLPEDVPAQLDGLPEHELASLQEEAEEEDDDKVTLSPDMVTAQFVLIDGTGTTQEPQNVKTSKEENFPQGNKMPPSNIPVSAHGPIAREKREEELEIFLSRRYNRLGARIQARADTLNNLKTNPDLVLK